jgi:hypothetical protein
MTIIIRWDETMTLRTAATNEPIVHHTPGDTRTWRTMVEWYQQG